MTYSITLVFYAVTLNNDDNLLVGIYDSFEVDVPLREFLFQERQHPIVEVWRQIKPYIHVATFTYSKSTSSVLRGVRRVHDHCVLRLIVDNQISIVIVTPGPFDMFSAMICQLLGKGY